MESTAIEANLRKVFRMDTGTKQWSGRVHGPAGWKGHWEVDAEDGALVSVPSQHIIELGKPDDTESNSTRCWCCGSTERDEDGECAKCHDPYPNKKPVAHKNRTKKAEEDASVTRESEEVAQKSKIGGDDAGHNEQSVPDANAPEVAMPPAAEQQPALTTDPLVSAGRPKVRTPRSRPHRIPVV